MACILGLDIGTTSTVGILIRLPDQVVGVASRPATLRSPRRGWAEQDPRKWWANACEISRRRLSQNGVAPDEVEAIGVTGMLPAVVGRTAARRRRHPHLVRRARRIFPLFQRRRIGRPPNVICGVGFIAQGFDVSSYYRRAPDAGNPRAAFIFEDVADEIIGNFGLVVAAPRASSSTA
jgi:hypothetical protein